METIKRQASRLREQVAQHHQAVLSRISGRFVDDSFLAGEAKPHCDQQLKKLYSSIVTTKRYMKDLIRDIENLISASLKDMEIVSSMANTCCKYGDEKKGSTSTLASASLHLGKSHYMIEKERENLVEVLGSQVADPLRAFLYGAPLEDARHLTRQYERISQKVEVQTIEVVKRQSKLRDESDSKEISVKLQDAKSELLDLRSSLCAFGREATTAMKSVEDKQQQATHQGLLVMVRAERFYHQCVTSILDELHAKMVQEEQHCDSAPQLPTLSTDNLSKTSLDQF